MQKLGWWLIQGLAVGVAALLLGLLAGWLTWGRVGQPPEEAPATGPALAPAVALPTLPTPTDAPKVADLVKEPARTAKPTVPAPEPVATPDVVEEKRLEGDPTLLPRGPGHTALLDLGTAGLPQLVVRAGSLNRDGAANWATYAKRPRVATLTGPEARVELLHLGLDADARPILAHIRTVDAARVEGIVPLIQGETRISVLADPDPPVLEPPPQKAAPEDDDGAPAAPVGEGQVDPP